MRISNVALEIVLLVLALVGTVSGAVWHVVTDSGRSDGGTGGSPQAGGGGAAVSKDGGTILTSAECARLRELGSGVRLDLQGEDFALVEKALTASNTNDRQWACLAVEKLCYSQGYTGNDPELERAARLARMRLNQAYVDRSFPRLLDAADAKNPDLAEFAFRAIEALARDTKLLTSDQVAKSCDKAVAGLRSDDFEERRRGVNLLGGLMRRLDLNGAREKQAIDQLLEITEDWQRSYHWKWDEWQREVSARGTAKQRFQSQALQAMLYNCGYIPDKTQAMRAYQFLMSGLADQTLDLQAVVGVAALASRLPAEQRRNAVQLAIRGVSDKRFWHDVGSGEVILSNYAADALSYLAPCLDKDEVHQAIKAIDSQRWNREESKVFEAATIALRDRLGQLK
jgi:hypothetical protein